MRNRCALALIVAGTLAVSGCCKKGKKADPNAVSVSSATVAVSGNVPSGPQKDLVPTVRDAVVELPATTPPGKVRFSVQKGAVSLSFSLPRGSRAKVGGKDIALSDTGSGQTTVDILARLGTLPAPDAFKYSSKYDFDVTVELDIPGFSPASVKLPEMSAAHGLRELFTRAQDAPVVFDAKTQAPKDHTILHDFTDPLGPATKVDEVDYVAIGKKLPGRTGKTCTGYRPTGKSGGPSSSYTLEMIDEEVAVYDRFTAKEVARKTFVAKNECPYFVSGAKATSYASSNDVKAWLRELRRKK